MVQVVLDPFSFQTAITVVVWAQKERRYNYISPIARPWTYNLIFGYNTI